MGALWAYSGFALGLLLAFSGITKVLQDHLVDKLQAAVLAREVAEREVRGEGQGQGPSIQVVRVKKEALQQRQEERRHLVVVREEVERERRELVGKVEERWRGVVEKVEESWRHGQQRLEEQVRL